MGCGGTGNIGGNHGNALCGADASGGEAFSVPAAIGADGDEDEDTVGHGNDGGHDVSRGTCGHRLKMSL